MNSSIYLRRKKTLIKYTFFQNMGNKGKFPNSLQIKTQFLKVKLHIDTYISYCLDLNVLREPGVLRYEASER